MKLLIKLYLEDTNTHDITQILNAINYSISDKVNTTVYLMTTDKSFRTTLCETLFISSVRVPEIINYRLSNLEWDIVLPITIPILLSRNFDVNIKDTYKEKFPNLDGVLFINDGLNKDNKIPIIGRKYYNDFGYVYNPSYGKKNYKEEFSEVLNINNKYHTHDIDLFKNLDIKSDDDQIYNLRKDMNFGLTKK